MPDKEIARRLYAERYFRRYTQKELSEHLGISPSSYSAYENGKRDVPDTVLRELASLYHINVNYLRNKSNDKYLNSTNNNKPNKPTSQSQQPAPYNTLYHFVKTVSIAFCLIVGIMMFISGLMIGSGTLDLIGIVLVGIGIFIAVKRILKL